MDINSYVWSFESSQLSSFNSSSGKIGERKPEKSDSSIDFFTNQSSRMQRFNTQKALNKTYLKQYGVSPAIQALCKCLDEDLSKLLSDIEFSTNLNSANVTNSASEYINVLNEDFKLFNEYLQECLASFGAELSSLLKNQIESLKQGYANSTSTPKNIHMIKILLLCRLVHALPNFCPNLKISYNNINLQMISQREQLTRKILYGHTASLDDSLSSPSKKISIKDHKVIRKNIDNFLFGHIILKLFFFSFSLKSLLATNQIGQSSSTNWNK